MINGPETHVDAIERERGFLEGLANASIYTLVKRHGDFLIQSGFLAMKSILEELTPDALFCANDYMAPAPSSASGRRVCAFRRIFRLSVTTTTTFAKASFRH
jgi:ABC-type sugar transport system substrate-binding protein